jgi:hypothetical protein
MCVRARAPDSARTSEVSLNGDCIGTLTASGLYNYGPEKEIKVGKRFWKKFYKQKLEKAATST